MYGWYPSADPTQVELALVTTAVVPKDVHGPSMDVSLGAALRRLRRGAARTRAEPHRPAEHGLPGRADRGVWLGTQNLYLRVKHD